ncbi:nucleoside kinase [Anaerotignum lactatifermentans]|uniref:nucleoside kinase n=1 Tax=Anaerotignum lactatifermentans TaxID=160404 RepID=UPI00187436B2|nr:nucleoside kinase [Anaerotignum lactatifermentans]MBE5076841.1 nucleoside kinase [Anaerotignum lactatifermentans]
METRQINVMGKMVEIAEGATFADVAKDFSGMVNGPIMLARQKNKLRELHQKIRTCDDVTFYGIENDEAMRVYRRGVLILMTKAVYELWGSESLVVVEHSLQKNLYCEIRKPEMEMTEEVLAKIEGKMREYVAADLPICKRTMRKEDAREIARRQGMPDKDELFRYRRASNVNLYELDGFYDYFYGYMPASTGDLKVFSLMAYENGFLIRFPDPKQPEVLREFSNPKKISSVFLEQMHWCQLMGVKNVAELNYTLTQGKFGDLIRINEALHEKKIAEIADMIHQRLDKVRVVLIAGPSSSGKTSFANRLCIQLQVLGIQPHKISLDDYFVERDKTPVDENGKRNYEHIQALDLPLLNDDLKKMIAGELVDLPTYNFVTGKREYNGNQIQTKKGEILVLEGIHGLNDMLTSEIPAEQKFKIFISAMTQLNVDDHNRISTSDSRLIRRIVRDYQFRGRDAAETIRTWNDVTDGEAENIFPYQENADAIFNSATIYELSVLKQYAEPQLFAIGEDQPEYITAKRLIKFLGYFLAAPGTEIPNNSLIKEFVGGSCFKV